ncbi:MAG: hypothetical protein M0C28_35550 [Candidatus Moduliflexus flocculans]|nr:hypothetical protein [Candidatus Moduliflexus flocculans]
MAAGRTGYYRFPAIHGDTVVFTSEGDLWTVDVRGGTARRLTSHSGIEAYPAISPDGQTLAFSAQYEGPTEVYTMPLAGGLPARRTFAGQGGTRRRLDPGRQDPLRHAEVLDPAQRPARASSIPATNTESLLPLSQAADGSFDAGGPDALFHAPPLPGQLHQALQGRHGPEPVVLRARRRRGRAPDRRLRRHEQEPDGLEGPRLLPERPRRLDEHLVHGPQGRRSHAAHLPQGLRRQLPEPRCRAASPTSSWPTSMSTTSPRTRTPPWPSRCPPTSTRCARGG